VWRSNLGNEIGSVAGRRRLGGPDWVAWVGLGGEFLSVAPRQCQCIVTRVWGLNLGFGLMLGILSSVIYTIL
jgi:hypothetical protein